MSDLYNSHVAHSLSIGEEPLRLLTPYSPDFNLYGGPDVTMRAMEWANKHHYLLVDNAVRCAHQLYRMYCLGECGQDNLDHARVWVKASGGAFVLAHLYAKEVPETARFYAKAHGLELESNSFDNWYNHATIPVRYSTPANFPIFPLEYEAVALLAFLPPIWPGETPHH